MSNRSLIERQFTIQSYTDVETLTLSMLNLSQMKNEFCDYYEALFEEQFSVLRFCWHAKLKAIIECRKQLREQEQEVDSVS
jgi:hypothetical protein